MSRPAISDISSWHSSHSCDDWLWHRAIHQALEDGANARQGLSPCRTRIPQMGRLDMPCAWAQWCLHHDLTAKLCCQDHLCRPLPTPRHHATTPRRQHHQLTLEQVRQQQKPVLGMHVSNV